MGKDLVFLVCFVAFLLSLNFIRKVEGLKCFGCSSRSKQCDKKQVSKVCGDDHDMCYSMTYATQLDITRNRTVEQFGSSKGCGNSRHNERVDCQQLCQWYKSTGFYCKVSCCFGNNCNRNIIVNHRTKRRLNHACVTKHNWGVLILGVILSFLIKVTIEEAG